MERDRYFTAQAALDYGLIDRIIERHELTRVTTGFRSAVGA
jgi:ATP-dependent protease ClpP protease subunit